LGAVGTAEADEPEIAERPDPTQLLLGGLEDAEQPGQRGIERLEVVGGVDGERPRRILGPRPV
jgi:hypothetical protein